MAKLTLRVWATTLIGNFVRGGAVAALSGLGLAGASGMGLDVQPLNFKQLGWVFLSGAIIMSLRFLEKAPVPEFDPPTGDTTVMNRNEENTNE